MHDGKEFYNKHFQALMKWKNIHDFTTSGDTKASIVEWFNGWKSSVADCP